MKKSILETTIYILLAIGVGVLPNLAVAQESSSGSQKSISERKFQLGVCGTFVAAEGEPANDILSARLEWFLNARSLA